MKFYSKDFADGLRAIKATTAEEAAMVVATKKAREDGMSVYGAPRRVNILPQALGGEHQFEANLVKNEKGQAVSGRRVFINIAAKAA